MCLNTSEQQQPNLSHTYKHESEKKIDGKIFSEHSLYILSQFVCTPNCWIERKRLKKQAALRPIRIINRQINRSDVRSIVLPKSDIHF